MNGVWRRLVLAKRFGGSARAPRAFVRSMAIVFGIIALDVVATSSAFADPPPARADASSAPTDDAAQRRREIEDLRRQDLATELGQRGVTLKWQEHSLAELTDWRDRANAAYALHIQFGVDVDWRATSLHELTDMRLRAAKASELQTAYGLQVDWRGYSWAFLEGLRRTVAGLPPVKTTKAHVAADDLATPEWQPASARPRARGPAATRDPDALIEPSFALDTPLVWSRPFGRQGPLDPDAILVPTFVTVPTPPPGRDDVIDPWSQPR